MSVTQEGCPLLSGKTQTLSVRSAQCVWSNCPCQMKGPHLVSVRLCAIPVLSEFNNVRQVLLSASNRTECASCPELRAPGCVSERNEEDSAVSTCLVFACSFTLRVFAFQCPLSDECPDCAGIPYSNCLSLSVQRASSCPRMRVSVTSVLSNRALRA